MPDSRAETDSGSCASWLQNARGADLPHGANLGKGIAKDQGSADDLRMEHAEPARLPGESTVRDREGDRTASASRSLGPVLLDLQRTVGNRLVGRMVQRVPPTVPVKKNEPAGAVDATYFTVAKDEPAVTGTTHVDTGAASTNVRAVAPRFDWRGHVTVAKDLPGGVGIDVGFQQVLKGSTRRAQYKPPGGQQFGYTIATPESRDAALEVAGQSAKGIKAGEVVVPPGGFFSENSNVGGRARVTVPPVQGEVGEPAMFDQPSWDVEKVLEGAPLVGTGGEDKFHVSLVAKEQGKSPVFLANREWAVNWDQTIDAAAAGGPASKGGQGIAVTTSTDGVPQLDGSTPHFLGKAWYQFANLAAASSAPTTILMQNLALAAAGGDSQSHGFTVAALRARNPEFKISVACSETAAFFGKDSISLRLNGVASKSQTMTLGMGDWGVLKAPLLEIFPDPSVITSATPLSITLTVTSDRKDPSATTSVAYPFLSFPVTTLEVGNIDSGTFTIGGGLY